MERELWPRLYHLVEEVGAAVRQKGVTYQPALIVLILLWAALHDRPVEWACDGRNWSTTTLRPIALPAPSTMSRRLRSVAVAVVLRALEERLRAARPPALVQVIDGKPLPVGGLSHDPDARTGHGAGKIAKGYKLDAIWAGAPMPEAWALVPLDINESRVAPELIAATRGEGYLLGDNVYDSSALYDAAAARGLRLLAPRKDPEAGISPGHYQSPERLRAIDQMRRPFGAELLALRSAIERDFGNASVFAGGLSPLPAWVRRHHRVLRWVWAKLIINGVRIVMKQRLTA
jgi:DDE family transposase